MKQTAEKEGQRHNAGFESVPQDNYSLPLQALR